MIYDHLFGTYAKETAPAVYGITHNINTQAPVTILLHEYIRLKKELPKIKGLRQKLRYLFSSRTLKIKLHKIKISKEINYNSAVKNSVNKYLILK